MFPEFCLLFRIEESTWDKAPIWDKEMDECLDGMMRVVDRHPSTEASYWTRRIFLTILVVGVLWTIKVVHFPWKPYPAEIIYPPEKETETDDDFNYDVQAMPSGTWSVGALSGLTTKSNPMTVSIPQPAGVSIEPPSIAIAKKMTDLKSKVPSSETRTTTSSPNSFTHLTPDVEEDIMHEEHMKTGDVLDFWNYRPTLPDSTMPWRKEIRERFAAYSAAVRLGLLKDKRREMMQGLRSTILQASNITCETTENDDQRLIRFRCDDKRRNAMTTALYVLRVGKEELEVIIPMVQLAVFRIAGSFPGWNEYPLGSFDVDLGGGEITTIWTPKKGSSCRFIFDGSDKTLASPALLSWAWSIRKGLDETNKEVTNELLRIKEFAYEYLRQYRRAGSELRLLADWAVLPKLRKLAEETVGES